MELTTVLELVKAGFSHDEIVQLANPSNPNTEPVPAQVQNTVPDAEPVPAQVAEPVAPAVPVPQPQPQPAQTQPTEPTMADIMQGIAKLTSAVQANAIAQSVIPQGLQNPPKAEDMLAEIIRPSFQRRD